MPAAAETFTVAEMGILFKVEGDPEKTLKRVSRGLDMVNKKLKDASKGQGGDLLGGVTGSGNAATIINVINLMERVNQTAQDFNPERLKEGGSALENMQFQAELAQSKLRGMSNAIMGPMKSIAQQGVMTAGHIEKTRTRLEYMAKKKFGERFAKDVYANVEKAGLTTLQTTSQVADLTFGLMTQKIDPFAKELERIPTGIEGMTSTAIETLSDAATVAPWGMRSISMGIRDALGVGKVSMRRGLGAALDLNAEQIKRYNKSLKQAKGPQEKFNALVKELAADYGGLAKSQKDVFLFNLDQIGDYTEKLSSEIFGGVLPKLSKAIQGALNYFQDLIDSGKLKPISEAIEDIADTIITIAKWAGKFAAFLFDIVAANPWILKLAVYFGTLLAGLAAVAGVAAGFMGTLSAMKWLMGFIVPLLKSAVASLMSMAPLLAPILGIVAAFALLARWLTGAESWVQTWEYLKLIFSGIYQLITSMADGTASMSADTASALEKAGLLDFVVRVAEAWNALMGYVKTIWGAVVEAWTGIANDFVKVWEASNDAFGPIIDAVGWLIRKFLDLVGISSAFEADGRNVFGWVKLLANVVAGMIKGISFVVRGPLQLILLVMEGVQAFIEGVLKPALDWVMSKVQWIMEKTGLGEEEPTVARGAPDLLGSSNAGQAAVAADPARVRYAQTKGAALLAAQKDIADNERRKQAEEKAAASPKTEKQTKAQKREQERLAKLTAKYLADAMRGAPIQLNGKQVNEAMGDEAQRAMEAGA